MKGLSKLTKSILTVILVITTLITGLLGCAGVYAIDRGYYSLPQTSILKRDLADMVAADSEALIHDLIMMSAEETLSRDEYAAYAEEYSMQSGVNFYLAVNTVPVFTNIDGTTPLASYEVSARHYTATLRISLKAALYMPQAGTKYAHFYNLVTLLHTMRYAVWIFVAVGICIILACTVLLLLSAGRRKGAEGTVCSTFLRRLPFSVLTLFYLLIAFGVICISEVADSTVYSLYEFDLFPYIFPFILSLFWLIGYGYLNATVKKIRTGTLVKSLILYRLFCWLHKKVLVPLFGKISYLWKNLSLWWKGGIIVLGGLTVESFIICFFCIACFNGEEGMIVFLVLLQGLIFLALLGISGIAILNLKELKSGAIRIKEGGLNEKIDTSRMFWEFKQHAENLNSIGEGVQHAVNEQMKSERFQTELITNVSHDIKTPMTSIINYIDLLDKLDLDNDTAKEYIEVLTRQSARLKKLTEDLVEASKAQSGCITPILVPLDFSTVVTQTIGEYTDRLQAAELTPVIRLPEQPVMILADGKMLWRVIDNLLSNIVKYSMPMTRVFIDLSENGKLSLKNISREELNISGDELSKRFVRGDASRSGVQGSGLGLSIAMSLTELMNGKLAITIDGDLFKAELSLPITQLPVENDPPQRNDT